MLEDYEEAFMAKCPAQECVLAEIVHTFVRAKEPGPNLRAAMPEIVLIAHVMCKDGPRVLAMTREALGGLAESLALWDRALTEEDDHDETP